MDKKIELLDKAVNFSLIDTRGLSVQLADFIGKKNIVLVFNRGFA